MHTRELMYRLAKATADRLVQLYLTVPPVS
jgi:hypothetical protein